MNIIARKRVEDDERDDKGKRRGDGWGEARGDGVYYPGRRSRGGKGAREGEEGYDTTGKITAGEGDKGKGSSNEDDYEALESRRNSTSQLAHLPKRGGEDGQPVKRRRAWVERETLASSVTFTDIDAR